jgi:hypothetical protein
MSREALMSENKNVLETDYRKVDQEKAPSIFSEPNELADALKNLEDYENWGATDNVFQSTDGDKAVVEKHEPYDDADKAKKVKASKDENQMETKKTKNIEDDLKELLEILKDSDAYSDYLGLNDADFKNERVNTKEFPMD